MRSELRLYVAKGVRVYFSSMISILAPIYMARIGLGPVMVGLGLMAIAAGNVASNLAVTWLGLGRRRALFTFAALMMASGVVEAPISYYTEMDEAAQAAVRAAGAMRDADTRGFRDEGHCSGDNREGGLVSHEVDARLQDQGGRRGDPGQGRDEVRGRPRLQLDEVVPAKFASDALYEATEAGMR
jgi:hypothetical protein